MTPNPNPKPLSRAYNKDLPLVMLIIVAGIYLSPVQTVFASKASNNSLSMLRAEALEAEGSGEFNRAEALYEKALRAARQSASKTKVVEFLSRIVQVRIENNKLSDTDALVQEVVELAQSLKNSSESTSTLTVWLNDMTDAFYAKGEHTTRDDTKEYCLKRYLDIRLVTDDHFDSQLLAKANLLTLHLQHLGRYREALPYVEKSLRYQQRTNKYDPKCIAAALGSLGAAYLLVSDPIKAENLQHQCIQIQKCLCKDVVQQGISEKCLGVAEFEKGNFEAARKLYRHALELYYPTIGRTNIHTNHGEVLLGLLEQHVGNLKEAAKYFRAGLDGFDRCQLPDVTPVNKFMQLDGMVYSGQVICAEHLAQIAAKQGDLQLFRSLLARAKKIRAKNPDWQACNNPAPETFYMISGHFPFRLEIIPTRSGV